MTITVEQGREALGRRVKAARALADLDQEVLAELVGISRPTLSGWENGTGEPTITQAARIARATGQPIEWLLDAVDSELCARRDSNPQPSDP